MRTILILAVILAATFVGGCASGKQQIGEASKAIRAEATATKADIDGAIGTGEVGPSATPFLESAVKRQDSILSFTERVNQALGKVEDKNPYLEMIGRGLWVLGALAIIVFLIYFMPIIKPIMAGFARLIPWAFAWVIPAPTRTQAEMDVKTIRAGPVTDPHQIRAIETRKQTDPMYRAAFDLQMKEQTP